jgi:anti-sigma factor RsiW
MLIHLTMEDLLAVRDGEGSAGARRHLDECDQCREELERLHQRAAALKALPSLSPPRDRWPMVREQVLAIRARQRRKLGAWISVAAAASIALAVGVGGLVTPAADQPDNLVVLMQETQRLENVLRSFQPETRVLSGRMAGAVAALEDEIVLVDARLARARSLSLPRQELIVLWSERLDLVDALLNVHASRSTYMGF